MVMLVGVIVLMIVIMFVAVIVIVFMFFAHGFIPLRRIRLTRTCKLSHKASDLQGS
jgi:hypothetical protein